MTRRRILEALRNGEVELTEARRAVLANGTNVDSTAPASGAVAAADLEQLQAELVQSLASALYMEPADIQLDLNFKDMGLDSIVGVEWVNHLKKQYGLKISATKVYDHPTILRFADYLAGLLKTSGRAPVALRSNPGTKREISAPALPPKPARLPAPTPTAASMSIPQARPAQAAPTKRVHPPGSIAIVGMSGRYPGAPDLARFWENLAQGKNSIREIPRERWDVNDYFDADPSKPGKIYCKWLGALDEIDCFDAPFFQISPAEAEGMDPQYRIFLEAAYQAFEDAGYGARSLSNRKCGVYMGVMNSEYVHLLSPAQAQGLNTGNSHSIAAARVSYFLNLKGPAIPIDTACSSSLVATHLACQALRNGEVEMALVGGVTLYLTPASFIGMCAAGMLSPDGQCKSFDNGANGFVPGEGAGALVLKRLEDAERDGNHIHGVIIGSGINQDGRTNGITAPSVQSQIELERDVYQRFGIDPETIDYVETHGTGTKLGDPVELEALTTVFRERTKRRGFCALGSVKSNIGHTSAAAGMAGVQKMLLCFKHRTLVPSLHFREANTHCDFEDSPFYVNTETKPWPARPDAPRRAAVSSMGFSGTNAHLVIEEYLGTPAENDAEAPASGPELIVLSAKNEARLAESVRRLHGFLSSGARRPALSDLAYTLQIGRDGMEERLALLVRSMEELVAKLGSIVAGRETPDVYRGRVPRVKGKLAFQEADESMNKVVAAWLEKGHWGKLLERWAGGLNFDWRLIHGEARRRRVSLPTYPFARERHWVKSEVAVRVSDAPRAAAAVAAEPAKAKISLSSTEATPAKAASSVSAEPVRVTLSAPASFLAAPARDGFAKPSGLSLGAPERVAGAGFSAPGAERPRPRALPALDAVAPDPDATAREVAPVAEISPRVVLKAKDALEDLKAAVGGNGNMVPTLNRTGVMLEKLTPSSQAFARFAGSCGGEVLDIGCAYGVATIAALEAGATVLAVDMEPRHLEILEARVTDEARPRLRTQRGVMPEVDFAAGRFAAIHAARVIHFLRPEELRVTLRKMFSWLRPGGALFLISDTPYVGYWKTKAGDYEARKARGDQWPGYIEDVRLHFSRRDTDGAPPLINALDPDVLRRECEAAGFVVEQAGYEGLGLDLGQDRSLEAGREHAGLTARKPASAAVPVVQPREPATPAPAVPVAPATANASNAADQIAVIQSYLKESLADALHTKPEEVDDEMPFIELGVDSVISVTWVRGINTRFGLSIGATRIYDYPSVRQFAEFLNDEIRKTGRVETSQAASISVPVPAPVAQPPQRPRADEPRVRETPRPYGLVLSQAHVFSELELESWKVPAPAETEVTIQVRASAISFTDTICVKGLYPAPYPFVPGLEIAGVVTQVGSGVSGLRVGDEVIALTGARMGGHAEFVNVPASHAVAKPAALSFEEACSLPLAFGAMYYALEQVGRLAPREHVLIQTATGGCGLMALQLARLKGCVCHGTSSREEKREVLRRLGVSQALDYKTPDFAAKLRRRNGGRGVDVVVNMVAGDAIQQGLNSLAPSGRYLELATHALLTSSKLDLSNLRFNQSLQVVAFLEMLSRPEGGLVRELLARMVEWVQAGKIVPTVSRVYPVSRITEALEFVAEGRHVGKVVVSHTAQVMEDRLADCLAKLDAQRKRAEAEAEAVAAVRIESAGVLSPSARPVAPRGRDVAERVAIVGMSGRFPKSPNLAKFWENLAAGRDCVSEIPASRWPVERFYDPEPARPGKTCCKWMGVLEDIDRFDPLFFQISPAEARMMDPQQRLFIESCWSCLEDAGVDPRRLSGSNCGVFAGCGIGDYGLGAERDGVIGATGVAPSILPARVSYLLNLKGPCLAIDTSCSSSLVAIANACDSLVLGNCDLALAGGVLVMTGPSLHIGMSQGGMLSPDGRCFTFDERANGFVPGEGVGVVLLKRLSDAVRDGDNIHGVIQGWGVNQDGKTNGITAPSMQSQAALERDLHARFGIDPETISLVEAHGTGTRLGDPIEVEALTAAFRVSTQKQAYCALGSVKSNIGHLGVAAGVAGVLKVLLALRHRTLPPTVNFQRLNPHIPLAGSPFYISERAKAWDATPGRARRACVSSFGFSGTNAHLIIEEAPASSAGREAGFESVPALVVLSAKTEDALRETARNLRDFLTHDSSAAECGLHDIAHTLQVGREAMGERLGFVAPTKAALGESLEAWLAGREVAGLRRDQVKRLKAFVAAFKASEQSRAVLEQALRRNDHAELLELWVKGVEIDWQRLYVGRKPRRVSLPTYPFARERYWFGEEQAPLPATPAEVVVDATSLFMANPVWANLPAVAESRPPECERHLVLLGRPLRSEEAALRRRFPAAEFVVFESESDNAAERFGADARQAFAALKEVLGQRSAGKVLVQALVGADEHGALAAGLAALFKTARLENPRVLAQLIEVEPGASLANVLAQAAARSEAAQLRVHGGVWSAPALAEIPWSDATGKLPWKDGGVYLITGGAGGLGRIFAGEIAKRSPGVTLVLAGRSSLSAERAAALRELEGSGAKVVYRSLDVVDAMAVTDLVRSIRAEHGRLDGVIHAAGLIRDNFILKKDAAEFSAVLAPKVAGVVNLDQATRELPLDFFVIFSSGAGATGNAGQADYAAANAFLDGFALWRSDEVEAGRRFGRTLSLNWPLWRDGGMRVDATTERVMRERTGMAAMESAAGITAFYRAMATGRPQIMVVAGDVARIRQGLVATSVSVEASSSSGTPTRPEDVSELRGGTLARLKGLLGEIIDLPAERIEADEPLESYGIDSLMVTRLNQQLARVYPEVSQTLFFEFKTLGEIASHFVTAFPEESVRWTGFARSKPVLAPATAALPVARPELSTSPGRVAAARPDAQEPIAIIGISGRYAQAETLEAFWANLVAGKDCVTEIPSKRWALDGFFEADPEAAIRQGKSYSKWGSFLEGFAEFDPLFFNISPLEALGMDPQERLFLQAAWEAVEAAGYTRARLAEAVDGNVGVFAGVTKTGFELYREDWRRQGEIVTPYTSFGSIANRVSYVLNLKGPSMPIDTMCSSSLTAIHEACEQLRRGACRMAIAGGVNLYLHPSSYVGLCAQRMLSRDGKCKSFGEGGNGFVPGEGVGVVLLKPLSQARADGDPIHAIIRGTSVNHGGKTNGYTVPNPNAQREVIRDALEKSGLDARAVSYVEAHGTGTELGDPIEVTGLAQAFAKDTTETGFCALGSAKSNLGHLEAAAGVAGLTKVVLQLRHGKLVPSLHAEALNPKIPFGKTPFVVQREVAEWRRPVVTRDGRTRELPRIAGISSFGAGGSNAHVILEEAPEAPVSVGVSPRGGPALVVLSAKTEERLRAYAKKLAEYLADASTNGEPDLHDLAYTLQTGREAMDERLALVVASLAELREKLDAFLTDSTDGVAAGVHRARVTRGADGLGELYADEDMVQTVLAWLRKGKLARIADLWVRGAPLDWSKLHGEKTPRRIVLPTYPFARETYWVEIKPTTPAGGARLHHLVHENTSDLAGLCFSSRFSGAEFFLADHVVNGAKVLPGVAYLEMARFAALRAMGDASAARTAGILIRNVIWARPISVEGRGTEVHLRLNDAGEDGLAFSVEAHDAGGAVLVRSQGYVRPGRGESAPVLELEHLRAEIAERRLSRAECYAAFTAMGVAYGPRFQGLDEVAVGAGQALARLSLPETLRASASDYGLHPSLMDAALQACIGLSLLEGEGQSAGAATFVPYALDELEMFGPAGEANWVWIRPCRVENSEARVPKLDLDLCDEGGRVQVALRGLSFRRFDGDAGRAGAPAASETWLMAPHWTPSDSTANAAPVEYDSHLVMSCGLAPLSVAGLREIGPDAATVALRTDAADQAQGFTAAAVQAFDVVRERLKAARAAAGRQLVQIAIPSDMDGALWSALAGLMKTLRLENPAFVGQVVALDPREDEVARARKLRECRLRPDETEIRYVAGAREVCVWEELSNAVEAADSGVPWKNDGVYLITGGAGGIGLIFAEAISKQVSGSTVVLCGRSSLREEKRSRLDELSEAGATIVYRQVDVSRRDEVARLIAEIRAEHGRLDGVLHAAGVIRDRLIVNKPADEFREVLAPKVNGAVYLDDATRELALDFFVLFAAGAGVLGNVGQADYATANAFLDGFARFRNGLVAAGKRRGRTLAVDWPFWAEGGMKMDAGAVAAMRDKLGLSPLGMEAGVAALVRAWTSGRDQVLVASGERARVRALFARPEAASVSPAPATVQANSGASLEEKAIAYFRELLSTTLRVPLARIHSDGVMSDLGIDSVVVMNLTNRLEEHFGALSKTLFFEHQTIRALARHFVAAHAEKLSRLFPAEEPRAEVTRQGVAPLAVPVASRVDGAKAWSRAAAAASSVPVRVVPSAAMPTESPAAGVLDIAIIGVSGRYPQARNVDEFWTVLREGRDCITEVPKERWDWRDYYSEDPARPKGHSSKWGGFIDDVDKFDPQFFHISPKIAPYLDPQERLILEETWKALEDAGYRREDLQKRVGDELVAPVGVYIGAMYGEYQLFGAEAALAGRRLGFAGNLASLANRVSYVLNLHGPSMMVDTMCSSSLTCLHLACQDLAAGRTDYGIAGGVNVTVHPNKYLMLSGGQFLSAAGRCESFGEGGAGYIPSEGVGVVVLKRLADAERDGDHIHGVIKASVVNHGGRTHGYSVPNPKAQERVVAQALRDARLDPRAISYIEAHGTGTKLGDPIEIAGLANAFGKMAPGQRCWVGSAKSNIGHCESAAGIAGLTKVLLQMKHGQIAPSLHSRVLNPHIDFASTPFVVNQSLREWERPTLDGKPVPRIAGISSFGAGGSNAHVIVEEYVAKGSASATNDRDGREAAGARGAAEPAFVVLSAKTEERLIEVARGLRRHLDSSDHAGSSPDVLRSLAYTLQVGREAMEERLGFAVNSLEELKGKLDRFLRNQPAADAWLRGSATEDAGVGEVGRGNLLERWVAGGTVEWKSLYGARPPRRISLPTYPFARKRFWVETGAVQATATPTELTALTSVDAQPSRGRALAAPSAEVRVWGAAPLEKPTRVTLAPLPAARPPMPVPAPEAKIEPKVEPKSETRAQAQAPAATAAATAAPESLRKELRTSLAQALFLEENEVGLDKPFLEMGLDSIVGVEWVNAINKKYGLTIPANQVYEYPSLRKFTDFLHRQLSPAETLAEAPPAPAPTIRAAVAAPVVSTPVPEPAPARMESRSTSASKSASTAKTTDIAIVGMAGRFPGGETLEEFWDLLQSGRNAFTSFPDDRDWDLAGFSPGGVTDAKIAATRGAFLREVDRFDPLFFQISPKEATTMDPGERLFLQETWKAIEDAGIVPATLSGRRWGVFCGNGGDYSLRIKDAVGYSPHVTLAQVPSRVSHCLNLTGPSQSIDAGCASALLAIAQACDHLVLGKCEAAIAGGVLVHSTPNLIVSASQVGLLASAEAGGRALDRSAAGMVPGEAVGVVVLKPLADALAAGDRIHGVIEGWANNHNGKTNGLVSPSVDAEAALFSEVYERYKIDPESIGLVEANAAGLPLADAAEVQALTRAFRQKTDRRRFCALGTVENNVGHGFHASGMSHMMKVLLGLRHRRVPGTPGAEAPDPALKLDESPFFVPTQTIPWTAGVGGRRRAAISSFGATGANVHLVIAEPPGPSEANDAAGAESARDATGAVLITLSAKTEAGLRQSARDLAAHFARREAAGERVNLRRLAANLLLRRSHFEHRCAVVAADVAELQGRLRELAEGRKAEGVLIGGGAESGERLPPALAGLAKSTIEALAAGTTDAKAGWLVLADLFIQGVPLELSALFSRNECAPLNLPGYAFEKRRCWIDAPRRNLGRRGGGSAGPAATPLSAVEGESETLAVLIGLLAEITGLSLAEIVPASRLSEYGVDSLLGMRLLNRINARFGGGFDASLLVIETIAGVAAEIARREKADGAAAAPVALAPAPGTWARPGFIETSVVKVGRHSADLGGGSEMGARVLESLVARGIGVWREADSLRFEYLARKEAKASVAKLVDNDEAVALHAFLHEGERCFPVSDMQRFALQESEVHGRTSFNLCQGFRIDMPVDAAALNEALNDLVRRHSIFRTGARLVGKQWMQVVRDELQVRCHEVVWPEIGTRAEFAAELARFQRARNAERFDASRPALFDVYLLHNETEFGAIVFHAHHFHADGFTLYLFQQELHERYLARKQGRPYAESARRAEYAHFALSQFAPERAEVARHWLDKLRGKRAAFALRDRAASAPGGASARWGAGVCELSISPELLSELEAFNRRHRTTLTQLVTCALAVLLHRLTGASHPIQMVYNLRDRAEFETVMGDFSASVPMLLELDERCSWPEVFRAYETAMLEIQRHKHFDFSVLIQAVGEDSGGLWGDVALDSNDRDAFGEVTDFAGRLIDIAMEDRPPVAPLLVCVVKTGGRMTVPLLYDRARFSARCVELLAENLRVILGQMTREPGRTVRDAEVLRELAECLEGMPLGEPENVIRGGLDRV